MAATDIRKLRLHNQHVAGGRLKTPAELVAHLGAVQAQEDAGGKWAIGLRLPGTTEADVEQAIANREIIRTWPMRGTLHFVASADIRWMLPLLTPRVVRRMGARYRQLEIDAETIAGARKVFIKALEGGKQASRPELYRLLGEAGIATHDNRGGHLLGHHAQAGLICFGAREGKQQTFALLDEWSPGAPAFHGDEAIAELTRRYFTSHGPATVQDFGWWSGLNLREIKTGLDIVGDGLVQEAIAGRDYWFSAPSGAPAINPRKAHLLPPFDEYTVAYKDRSAAMAPEFAAHASAGGMLFPLIVIGGKAIGTWRDAVRDDGRVAVAPRPFGTLTVAQRAAIAAASRRYAKFLGRALA